MSGKSNNQGRAYEFSWLHSLQDAINAIRPSQIIKNDSYKAAQRAWNTLGDTDKTLYALSAKSAIEIIFAMEPNIIEVDNDVLNLYIQNDHHGEEADVRDIIIERKDIVWEIGLSIKHNHKAVKHSRLSKTLDFGQKWYGNKCSQEYWDDIKLIFDFLEKEKANGKHFNELPSKKDDVYIPLLEAFMKEIRKKVSEDPTIPRKLVEYLLSRYDFYKIISIDSKRLTTIQSFNMYGTLNLASKVAEPLIKIPKIYLPGILLYLGMKPKSKTTAIMCFDNGWQFSFRIHNAENVIETSLKFDIQIVGIPKIDNVYNCKW